MEQKEILLRAPPLDGTGELSLMDSPSAREQSETLHNLGTLLQYKRNQTVYCRSEEADYIYFISSGVVRVFRSAENGKRQIISFRTSGDLCGLPQAGRYVNSAETVSAGSIYRLPWKLFHQLMLNSPYLQHLLLRKVASDFHQAQSRIIMLGQENILQRVASFLVSMMTVAQFFDTQDSLLYLPMNRFDMADYLGTCAETAGRALTRLEHMEIIQRLTPRRIRIIDANRLRTLERGPRRGDGRSESLRPAFPLSSPGLLARNNVQSEGNQGLGPS